MQIDKAPTRRLSGRPLGCTTIAIASALLGCGFACFAHPFGPIRDVIVPASDGPALIAVATFCERGYVVLALLAACLALAVST